MKENAGYTIRRSILFDNACGVVLGENPRAPAPFAVSYTHLTLPTISHV